MRHVQFNAIAFPAPLVSRAAEEAAFLAMQSYQQAVRELRQRRPPRSVLAIHASVLQAERVAASLALRRDHAAR